MFKKLFRLFSGDSDNSQSGGLAKSRLHFVLVQDRAGLGSDELAKFRSELVSVIEKYFVIDEKAFDINYRRENELTTLQINSPILVKRVDGPEEAEASEDSIPQTDIAAEASA